MVAENPFIPIKWMKEHTGMQGTEFVTDQQEVSRNVKRWLAARNAAMAHAGNLVEAGITKQIANRLLEPFMWHTCICTATEWENFFALRADPEAEIHIQALAHKMLDVANASTPKKLQPYEWHIPFGDKFDERVLDIHYAHYCQENPDKKVVYSDYINRVKLKIATARCARVSYMTFEGREHDYTKDIILYERLLKAGHMSPFEHCAQTMSKEEYALYTSSYMGDTVHSGRIKLVEKGVCGNFKGFIQLRKTLPNENKKDERFIRVGN